MFDLPIDHVKQEMVFFFTKLSSHPLHYALPIAGFIKTSPQKDYQTYSQLPLTDEYRGKITDLITTIGTKGKLDLLVHHKSRLEKLGDDIDEHVHPLRFLSVIFSNPQLKSYMGEINHDYFKWSEFIKGLSKRLNVEMKKGCVLKFLDAFSLEINVPAEGVRPLCEKGNWEELVEYLIRN